MIRIKYPSWLFVIALLHHVPAAAAEAQREPLWEVNLAGYSQFGEAYPASEDAQLDVVPLPYPIFRGKFLRIGDETDKPVTTRIFRRDRVKLDFDFGLNFPVDSKDVDARTGMPDLDLLLEAGPELELQFANQIAGGDLYLALQARGAASLDGLDPSGRGFIASSELKYIRPFGSPGTELKIRLTPEFASREYMEFFYGVEPQFATADRPAYRASAGYLGTRLTFSLGHEFTDRFEIRTGVRLGLYQGARNEDSPLFTRETTSSFYLAFLWKYWESERRAPIDRFSD